MRTNKRDIRNLARVVEILDGVIGTFGEPDGTTLIEAQDLIVDVAVGRGVETMHEVEYVHEAAAARVPARPPGRG